MAETAWLTPSVRSCGDCAQYAGRRGHVISRELIKRHALMRVVSPTPARNVLTLEIDPAELRGHLKRFLDGVHARHLAGLSIGNDR